jgi:hypothetical protein
MLSTAFMLLASFFGGAYWVKGKVEELGPNCKVNIPEHIREDYQRVVAWISENTKKTTS